MSAVNNLLDKYRVACSIASDSALAQRLGVSRQGVHQWRTGLSWPSEDHVIAMTKEIGESASHWLPLIAADRARNPEARKVWLRLAQAAAAIALTVLAWRHGTDGQALALVAAAPLDIMRNIAVLLAAGMALASMLPPRTHGRRACPANG